MKRILCIRADNMGDVIMTSPALHALKVSLCCNITLLTSAAGGLIAPCLPDIDEVIIANLPWVKTAGSLNPTGIQALTEKLKSYAFDAAVIFTVYSQSALPAAMLAFMAGIPVRVGYNRENPYHLLTHWVPDKEPYTLIQHQVLRDVRLVKQLGADAGQPKLQLKIPAGANAGAAAILSGLGLNMQQPFLLVHPGVSEDKRMYPPVLWKETVALLRQTFQMPVVLTGVAAEHALCNFIGNNQPQVYNTAGLFSVAQLASVVQAAQLAICVNTGTAHIAAAVQTPVMVLYATTNPQHTPWSPKSRVLYFTSPPGVESKNEVVAYVRGRYYKDTIPYPTAPAVVAKAREILAPQPL